MFACAAKKKNMIGFLLFAGSIGLRQVCVARAAATKVPALVKSLSTEVEPARRKKSPIYTRTGDSGTSSLYNGERRPKSDLIFETLGHQDELNAVLGIAIEHCIVSNNGLDERIVEIQSRLFDLGAAVATPVTSSSQEKLKYTEFDPKHTIILESWIDELDSQLPPLKNFILPSGGMSATHLNLARAVCRRAERSTVPLIQEGITDKEVGRYLNRLSDFLFVASRYASLKERRTETIWKKSQ